MEAVLLWLDDLDDIVFTVALQWDRLRRFTLAVGLGASFGLAASEIASFDAKWALGFSGVAVCSVSAWFVGAAFRALYWRHEQRSLSAA